MAIESPFKARSRVENPYLYKDKKKKCKKRKCSNWKGGKCICGK